MSKEACCPDAVSYNSVPRLMNHYSSMPVICVGGLVSTPFCCVESPTWKSNDLHTTWKDTQMTRARMTKVNEGCRLQLNWHIVSKASLGSSLRFGVANELTFARGPRLHHEETLEIPQLDSFWPSTGLRSRKWEAWGWWQMLWPTTASWRLFDAVGTCGFNGFGIDETHIISWRTLI